METARDQPRAPRNPRKLQSRLLKSLLAVSIWIGFTSSQAQGFSWESFLPLVERGERVVVAAPVFREYPLMEALWKRLKGGRGGVYLIGSREAPTDRASYFLVFSYWNAGLYLVDPWPLKPEGSFVVVDGRRGVIGPLVAGLADPEGKSRFLTEEEAVAWWGYAQRLVSSGKPFHYNLEKAALLHVMRRLGLLEGK